MVEPKMPDDYWLHVRGCDCEYCTWERAPKAPIYWCSKCGYRGPAQTDHQRPNGSGECGYIARLIGGVAPSPAPSMFAWRHGTPHGPAKLPGPTQTPYTEAIGQAGDAYHRQFQHAHPLPALWRWSELWERMCAAAGVSIPAGAQRHE